MIKHYLKLTKFGIVFLVLITALAGYGFATEGVLSLNTVLILLLGMYFVSSGSFTLNQAHESFLDAKMDRTKNRPIPQGVISISEAEKLGTIFVVLGLVVLSFINGTVVLLSLITLLLYNFFYTLRWKTRYPFAAVFFGAIPGALPVVIGYCAGTGSFLSIECIYLFLIMFLWQMPHFWALAFRYRKDYAKAQIPVLPLHVGVDRSFWHIGLYTFSYLGVALLCPLFLKTSFIYLVIAFPFCLKVLFEFYYFYSQKKWLPFFSWLNISLLVFLIVPTLDHKIVSFYLSY